MSRTAPPLERTARGRRPAAQQAHPWWLQPWWLYRRLTFHLRPLPHFLIIGGMRWGTTSTYSYLVQHPLAQGGALLRRGHELLAGRGLVPRASHDPGPG